MLDEASLLIRTLYQGDSFPTVRDELKAEMEAKAQEMLAPDYRPAATSFPEVWPDSARRTGLKPRSITEVELALLIGHERIVPPPFRDPRINQQFPYQADYLDRYRSQTGDSLAHWVPVVTEWLETGLSGRNGDPNEASTKKFSGNLARVLPTLDHALSVRKENDAWEVDRLGQALTRLLVDRLEGGELVPAEVSTESLLTYIVLCQRDLPEEVKSPPSTPET
jgi:hypothetical protein